MSTSLSAGSPRRIALTVEYDGTGLCGWQRQPNGPTVQEHIETALSELIGEPTQVVGASRTDAGVHAKGQTCHFDLKPELAIPADGVAKGLTAKLPESIAITAAREVAADFHSRFGALGKHYVYRILNRSVRSPLRSRQAWHVRAPLDLAAMKLAGQALVGEHAFDAFRASGCSAATTTRRIDSVDIAKREDAVEISVRGNAFLRNMVRIIAGTLTEVGRARISPHAIETIIQSRNRTQAGQTAPAAGLTLVSVFYEDFSPLM